MSRLRFLLGKVFVVALLFVMTLCLWRLWNFILPGPLGDEDVGAYQFWRALVTIYVIIGFLVGIFLLFRRQPTTPPTEALKTNDSVADSTEIPGE